ncbi:Tissue factor [Oryzias melastigma]|uniref:Tissue factor n=1 Tax=Oryzias melastigma TaxID=30732 RepID=A0A834C3L3_ORYME|nr:Tissue factor [Oryzias melastigma]
MRSIMASVETLLWVGVWMSAFSITTADDSAPKPENVRWMSLDFTTILTWTAQPSSHSFTVQYSIDNSDWTESQDCIRIPETKCDLTEHLKYYDRSFSADIQTEHPDVLDYDVENLPHTYSPPFNPYRDSNISAAEFSVKQLNETTVLVNITDPLTAIHKKNKQLTIRDIFQNDLQYKISYYKSQSTRKRDIESLTSTAEISGLDPGQSYCFMVAAYIPSRAKPNQNGASSLEQCTEGGGGILQELSAGAWVGVIFLVVILIIILVTVITLCCRKTNRNKSLQSTQLSAPV